MIAETWHHRGLGSGIPHSIGHHHHHHAVLVGSSSSGELSMELSLASSGLLELSSGVRLEVDGCDR